MENFFPFREGFDWDGSCVEEHRGIGGNIINRLDNGAFVGLIYSILVFS